MLRLHDYLASGNGYKIRLLLSHLGIPYELIEYDINKGETRTPAFLARNANGRIPVLELEDGRFLAESNAILFYLADGTTYLPDDPFERAETLQWMFFEQYSHEPFIATARFIMHYLDEDHPRWATLDEKREGGYAALGVMEKRLGGRDWFVDDAISVADIALFAYTHVADEGGFELDAYPNVRGWIDRTAGLPRHITIDQRP